MRVVQNPVAGGSCKAPPAFLWTGLSSAVQGGFPLVSTHQAVISSAKIAPRTSFESGSTIQDCAFAGMSPQLAGQLKIAATFLLKVASIQQTPHFAGCKTD
jgi:hypothetical protein